MFSWLLACLSLELSSQRGRSSSLARARQTAIFHRTAEESAVWQQVGRKPVVQFSLMVIRTASAQRFWRLRPASCVLLLAGLLAGALLYSATKKIEEILAAVQKENRTTKKEVRRRANPKMRKRLSVVRSLANLTRWTVVVCAACQPARATSLLEPRDSS